MVEDVVDLCFMNTYHMVVHPGAELVGDFGGLHKFTGRTRPIITDSGGFQIFSLAHGGVTQELKAKGKVIKGRAGATGRPKVTEEGVDFRSYRDGRRIFLTPETSVQAQKALGADIIIPLDELLPFHVSPQRLEDSFERTHRWQTRSLVEHLADVRQQAMFGVVHGHLDRDMRTRSASYLASLPFDGFAVGGSLGTLKSDMMDVVDVSVATLAATADERPRHLLGIADVPSIAQCVALGIDSFDSSFPTRLGRHGSLLHGDDGAVVHIKRGVFRDRRGAFDADCACPMCTKYETAYIHHLFKQNETTAGALATLHNVHWMMRFMSRLRDRIRNGEL